MLAVGPGLDRGIVASAQVWRCKGVTRNGPPVATSDKAVRSSCSCRLPFSATEQVAKITQKEKQGLNMATLPLSPISATSSLRGRVQGSAINQSPVPSLEAPVGGDEGTQAVPISPTRVLPSLPLAICTVARSFLSRERAPA